MTAASLKTPEAARALELLLPVPSGHRHPHQAVKFGADTRIGGYSLNNPFAQFRDAYTQDEIRNARMIHAR